ncbi:hypothetical protein J6590_101627, partial [Homalodisca vitripennis]
FPAKLDRSVMAYTASRYAGPHVIGVGLVEFGTLEATALLYDCDSSLSSSQFPDKTLGS